MVTFTEQTQTNLDTLAELNEMKDLRETYTKISGDVVHLVGLSYEIECLENDLVNGVRYAETLKEE